MATLRYINPREEANCVTVHSPPKPAKVAAVDALKPLPAGSSSRDVLDALTKMIEDAGLEVGDRLPPEIELARRMYISRAKVREALIAWQNMGIVTRNKKAGTRLAAEVLSNAIHMPLTLKLEAESLLRTHSVRRPLEIEAVRLDTLHASAVQKRTIMARAYYLMAEYDAGNDWREADRLFHAATHEATGNPLFGQLIQQIQQGFNEIYEAPFGQPHLGKQSITSHMPLAAAIVSGNAEQAIEGMRQIMDIVEDEVRLVMAGSNA